VSQFFLWNFSEIYPWSPSSPPPRTPPRTPLGGLVVKCDKKMESWHQNYPVCWVSAQLEHYQSQKWLGSNLDPVIDLDFWPFSGFCQWPGPIWTRRKSGKNMDPLGFFLSQNYEFFKVLHIRHYVARGFRQARKNTTKSLSLIVTAQNPKWLRVHFGPGQWIPLLDNLIGWPLLTWGEFSTHQGCKLSNLP
jgi:hypothetical protein